MSVPKPRDAQSGLEPASPRNGIYGTLDGVSVRLDRSHRGAYLIAGTEDRWVPEDKLRPIERILTLGWAFGTQVQVLEWKGDDVEVQLFEYQPWIEDYLGTYDRNDGTAVVTIPRAAVTDVREHVREYPRGRA